VFLKTYIDRLTFSFTDYLRNEKDPSAELHQWIRRNYFQFSRAGIEFDFAEVVTRRDFRSSSTCGPRRCAKLRAMDIPVRTADGVMGIEVAVVPANAGTINRASVV